MSDLLHSWPMSVPVSENSKLTPRDEVTREPRMVTADGRRIRIATRPGAPGQRPLVMFNGIGANLELLEPFVDAIDPRIPVLRFDVPGTGGSPTSWFPYRFKGLARAVAAICDQLGYAEVDVFGISWGGAAAQQFAHQFPARCRRLILAATSPGAVMVPASPKVLIKMISPLRYLRPGYMKEIAPIIYGGDFRAHPERLNDFMRLLRPGTPLGYFWQLFAGWGWTSIFWLHRLRQPTLLLAGTDDPLIRMINMKVMAKLIPHSRLVTFDCGHLFIMTRTAQVAREIGEFLTAPDEPSAA